MGRGIGILSSLCVVSTLASIGGASNAQARCVNTTTGVVVTAVTGQPTSNQTVVCDTAAPNPPPSSTEISAAPGSTNVTVTVLPGSVLSPTVRAIGVVNNSTVLNQGTVRTSGLNAFGISTTGNGSTLTNQGAIITTGSRGFGLDARGSNSTLINSGTINVSGVNAAGIRSTETTASTLIVNSGTITVTGSGASPDFAAGVLFQTGAAGTFINQAGGTVSSATDSGVRAADASVTVRNAGTITGGNGFAINLGNGNNIIEVTDGTINGAAVAGGGNNQFTMSGGTINGNVSTGNGANAFTISGGQINGSVLSGAGNDTMTWSGGNIAGTIALGAGNDSLTLRNLTDNNLAGTTLVNGGLGNDRLTFDNTSASGVERFVNWELIELTNRSQLTFNSTLVLGDAGTGTGALTIDAPSSILAGGTNSTIAPFAAGQLVTVTNAGTIDLANAGPPAISSLTIIGNYIGANGRLDVRTVVAGDGSPSDKLVISNGTGSGSTSILVTNAGGTGALTVSDGILLVQAVNGATTTPTAFSLARPVSAGAYNYFLFKGGVTPGSQDSWFLRSSIVAPPTAPPAATPTAPIPIPTAAPGTPPLPAAIPGADPIPLFRPEVAVQSAVPSTARTLILLSLGTFNERQGDQRLLREDMRVGPWGRVFGQQTREHFAQGARPDFDGTYAGFQAGADLWRFESANGHSDHIGFYVAQARANGTVHGSVNGFEGTLAGHVDVDASSYGGYWTHLGPSNWYIDAVVQGSYLLASPNSIGGISNKVNGNGFAGSIEAGYPIALAPWLMFEPQIQGIWQRVSFGNTLDPVSTITFDSARVLTGRAGALLRGTFGSAGALWQPYLKGNVWWGSTGLDTVTFATDAIQTGRNGGTTVEGGGGITGKLTRNVSIYGDASYLSGLSGEQRITLKGNVGLRVTW